MKIKTSELTHRALDWAVAEAHGDMGLVPVAYSTDWAFGGPIIEREGIELSKIESKHHNTYWEANGCKPPYHDDTFQCGDTPLIAAMRCYVASKLGDEVEIPEELK